MLGAVDLHELAHAVPAVARLVHGLEPLLAVPPEAVSQHPLPDRLDPEMEAVSLSQLLAGECRTEVGVVGRDQSQRLRSERRRIAAVCPLGPGRPGPPPPAPPPGRPWPPEQPGARPARPP